jgi:hypothetical protein
VEHLRAEALPLMRMSDMHAAQDPETMLLNESHHTDDLVIRRGHDDQIVLLRPPL